MTDRDRPAGRSRRSRWRPLGRWLLALVVGLLSLEAASHVALRTLPAADADADAGATAAAASDGEDARRERLRAALLESNRTLHPYLGLVRSLRRNAGPGGADWIAEHGFRGAGEVFFEPSEDRLVVAVLGGSVAALLVHESGQVLAEGLSAAPRFDGREVVLVNLARGAYKQPQQLMALNYLLVLGLHFDLVVNLDGFNEVALPPLNRAKGVNPFFPSVWELGVRGLDDPEEQAGAGEILYLRARRAERGQRFRGSPRRWSRALTLIERMADRRLARRLANRQRELLQTPPSGDRDFAASGPRREFGSDEEMYRELARVWRRGSLQMGRLCSGLGIEYFHFLQPNQYVPGSKPLSRRERSRFFRDDHPYRGGVVAGYPILRAEGERLRAAGVGFHDLTDLFADVGDTLYADDCCHLNDDGNRILASRLAAIIASTEP